MQAQSSLILPQLAAAIKSSLAENVSATTVISAFSETVYHAPHIPVGTDFTAAVQTATPQPGALARPILNTIVHLAFVNAPPDTS